MNAWCGLHSGGILGTIFIDEIIDGLTYLENVFKPVVIPFFEGEIHKDMVFQQDGAPAHYKNEVRHYLNENLPNRWIGRRESIEWPARSQDLFWGVMKNNVYTRKIKNLDHLKAVIVAECQKINDDPALLRIVCYSVTTRVKQCIAADGRGFEKYQ